jgi:hypothetical protein
VRAPMLCMSPLHQKKVTDQSQEAGLQTPGVPGGEPPTPPSAVAAPVSCRRSPSLITDPLFEPAS